MNDPIKLIIFDLDGTLVNAYKAVAESLNYTLVQMNYAFVDGETVKRTVGWGDRHLVGTFVTEKDLDGALLIYRQHHASALRKEITLLPGARKLLDELKAKNYLLAVASNRPMRFTQIVLDHLRIANVFDYVLCGDKVARPKPAADMLEQILRKFSLNPDEALYVGDMTIDVETGHAAGVKTVAVATGSSTRMELIRLNPFMIIDYVWDVIKIVEGLNLCGVSGGQNFSY